MSDEILNSPSLEGKAPAFDFMPQELEPFRGTGYELIPLHGKAPFRREWLVSQPLSLEDAKARLEDAQGNVGVRLRPGDLVLDFDPKNYEGVGRLEQLQKELGIDLSGWPHVVTGSGGHHFYMRVPDGFLAVGRVPGYPGVDVKTFGGQVVAPGSIHPATRQPYRWAEGSAEPWEEADAPKALLDLIRRPERQATTAAGKYEPEQLAEMLERLYPEDFRDQWEWLQLMMSCHYATGGAGKDEFVQWSIGDPQYADHAAKIGYRWDSLSADDGGAKVTERLLERLWLEAQQNVQGAIEDFADEPEVSGAIEAADAIEKDKRQRQRELVEDWVYIVKQERYLSRSDCETWSEKQFRTLHQSAWKLSESIHEAVVKDKLPIRKVKSPVYEPGLPEFLPNGDYNVWRDAGVKPERDDGLAKVFTDHIDYLFPDGEQGELLLDWLHFVALDVPVKVNFAPLVYGPVQGTGKSYIASVIERVVGRPNVGHAEADDLKKEFTGWAENRQLGIIEELMDVGRLEIANRLKTTITNETLRVRKMYADPFLVPNRLNLMAFSNHADALRLENSDRRWMVLQVPAGPRDDDYYAKIFELLDDPKYLAAVRYMLQQRRPKLNPKGSAPATRAKAEMRSAGQGDVEQWLDDQLEEEATPFDFDLVRLDDVWEHARSAFGRERNLRKRVLAWLQGIGAVHHPAYAKDDRPRKRLWSLREHAKWDEAGPAGRIDAWLAHYGAGE